MLAVSDLCGPLVDGAGPVLSPPWPRIFSGSGFTCQRDRISGSDTNRSVASHPTLGSITFRMSLWCGPAFDQPRGLVSLMGIGTIPMVCLAGPVSSPLFSAMADCRPTVIKIPSVLLLMRENEVQADGVHSIVKQYREYCVMVTT